MILSGIKMAVLPLPDKVDASIYKAARSDNWSEVFWILELSLLVAFITSLPTHQVTESECSGK